ncbi:TPA: methyltransferase domain-containing protein [Legionella pneumophila]|nr:methyltransferase domain-containing protein [Legionella pneumophila]
MVFVMTQHSYENPELYKQNNALQYNFAMKFLSKIVFDPNARVLDVGCGDGLITSEIAKIVSDGNILGTDISHKMIADASTSYSEYENLRFIQYDAEKIPFRDQFDLVVSFNCLHWVKDQKEALKRILNAAIPNGKIALLFSHKKSVYHNVIDSICSSEKWAQYFSSYSSPRQYAPKEYYKDLLNELGLDISEIQESKMVYKFESKGGLKGFFRSAGAQIKMIPDALKLEFLDDFANAYIKVVSEDDDGTIPLYFWCLEIVGTKPEKKPINAKQNSATLSVKL